MKCNPLRWLWGLIPIAGLTWFAVQWEHPRLEQDLTQRVEEQLRGTGLRWASSGFSGRDGVITGRAGDETDQSKALDLTRGVWGVRVVDNRTDLTEKIDKAENYNWSANRAAGRVRLTGLVPSEAVRQDILGVARSSFPGQQVDDAMRLVRGAPSPDVWQAGVTFGLKQLAGLKSGETRVDGLGFSIAGEAETGTSYKAVKAALANDLPRGIRLLDDRVTAPLVRPYTWAARHAGGQIALSGYVPSERVRGDVVQAARTAAPRLVINDRTEIGEGAPAGFAAAIAASVKEIAKLEEGTAELRDAALGVTGLANDETTAEAARRSLRGSMPAGIRLADAIRVRDIAPAPSPRSGPYVTGAAVDGERIVLTGATPNESARDAAIQAVRTRFPDKRVDNRMEIAPGAADGWLRCIDAGLFAMARVGNGRLALTERRLDVTGSTGDEDLAEAVPLSVRSMTAGECDPNVRIDYVAEPEPDLTWRARYTGSEIILDGEVPSQAARAQLLQQAGRLFRGARVSDGMRVVDNRSKRWPRAAETGLRLLADLTRGEASLVRQQLSLTGEARDAATIAGIREQLGRDTPKGYGAREQIAVAVAPRLTLPPPASAAPPAFTPPVVRPPPSTAPVAAAPPVDPRARACQDGLQTAAREGIIRFERASATIARESFVTLDRLASVARTCARVKIEIEGHTDAEGTPERNQRLSDRRAQAVVAYLARSGVEADKLAAIGYGETRPIAPNDTPDNRAKNRRIEFTVRE